VGVELEVIDLVRAQKPFLSASLFIHQGEDDPGKLGMPAVKQAVCGEVDDAVLIQAAVHHCRAVCGEVERFEALPIAPSRELFRRMIAARL
jgi:hypothetical protein